jgi:hypothetical protein
MYDRNDLAQIESMFDVMLCLPRTAWQRVLTQVAKKIGTATLRNIIRHECNAFDPCMVKRLGRGTALLNGENNRKRRKPKAGSQRGRRAQVQREPRSGTGTAIPRCLQRFVRPRRHRNSKNTRHHFSTADKVWTSRDRSQRPSRCLRYTVMRCPASCAAFPPARGVTDSASRLRV